MTSIIHAKVLKVLSRSVSIGYSVKRMLWVFLSNRVTESNSWNCINIKELEIVCVSVTVEQVG